VGRGGPGRSRQAGYTSKPMPSPSRSKRPSHTRQLELQIALGDLGTVLPRQNHGTPQRRAQGWYAELVDGNTHFLGDYTGLALIEIHKLRLGAGLD